LEGAVRKGKRGVEEGERGERGKGRGRFLDYSTLSRLVKIQNKYYLTDGGRRVQLFYSALPPSLQKFFLLKLIFLR